MARIQSKTSSLENESFVIPETPIGMSIAGSDCCAGAGVQADLKTFAALGIHGLTAVTAVVAESPGNVVAHEPVAPRLLAQQVEVLLQTYPVLAAKTGMLPTAEAVRSISPLLQEWKQGWPDARLVMDPVMLATTGTSLMDPEALVAVKQNLFPLADLITPNRDEAQVLLGLAPKPEASTGSPQQPSPSEGETDALAVAQQLADRYQTAILLKGGHAQTKGNLPQGHAIDILVSATGVTEYRAPRIPGGHRLHGTGCTLSAAITAGFCQGLSMEDAVAQAKTHITHCIQGAHQWGDVSALGMGLVQRPRNNCTDGFIES